MMRIHRMLQTVYLEDTQIRKVERLLGVRLPSVTDSDFEDQTKVVERAVGTFKAWFEDRKSDLEFLDIFKLYANPRSQEEENQKKAPDDEKLLARIQSWPAVKRMSALASMKGK
jgi:hypothetical protein